MTDGSAWFSKLGLDSKGSGELIPRLTQPATHNQSGFGSTQPEHASLLEAIKAHNAAEVASFHTPGHKGVAPSVETKGAWRLDLTELPALDQLSHPGSVLRSMQENAAATWGSQAAFISVNGASAAMLAAVLACASRGKKALLPTNAHRSAVNALIISGLEPVWYQPRRQPDWQTDGQADVSQIAQLVQNDAAELACVVVVSPTYAGITSDITSITALCRKAGLPLIVDEAHGAHFIPGTCMPDSALTCGADVVVHSMHKTLGALTQTGVVHVGKGSLVSADNVRTALNLLQTSSPSYLLMSSLEQAITSGSNPQIFMRLRELRQAFDKRVATIPGLHLLDSVDAGAVVDPLHMLLRIDGIGASALYDECCQWGIYPEAVIGNGVLFLLGTGSRAYEIETLADALEHIAIERRLSLNLNETQQPNAYAEAEPLLGEYVMPPRQAFLSHCETVDIADACGRIGAECIAPCPPGMPIVVPGMRITKAAIKLVSSMQTRARVIVESEPRR